MSEKIKDPRYRMLQVLLQGISSRLDALLNIGKPKPFVMDINLLSKAATLDDEKVDCFGADLIQISTDGDLSDVSYKVQQLEGGLSLEMEASESPHILGPIAALLITNDTAETGKSIRVARFQGSQAALAAIKHGTPQSQTPQYSGRRFYAVLWQIIAATPGYFGTDEALGATPTIPFVGEPRWTAKHVRITTIKHQFTPTNAVTYQLYLLEDATANDEQSEAEVIYDSGSGQVSGQMYIVVPGGSPSKLPVDARLTDPGTIWILVDWSGNPGSTSGYIKVYGEVLA